MKNATELKDMELEQVVGGDYGDAEKDNGEEPRYKEGQYVEVYDSIFHVATKRTKIIMAQKDPRKGYWCYIVMSTVRHGQRQYVDADSIESN